MSQITLRGFDQELEQQIRQLAEQEHTSLNKAALKLVRRGANLERGAGAGTEVIGNQLNNFIGSWDNDQSRDFDQAVAVFQTVDAELWQ